MTTEQVKKYITEDLGMTPKHDCEALAYAINDISAEVDYDSYELMQLLLENRPIDGLHTHSYGFHTANGRSLIDGMVNLYNEYEN
jgi:hypothetical protein